jgi:V/A-type H+/Na+-transporting ATPase subunit D
MAETAATKSAALALADERALMRQGYQFLDEKRMLLAAEMLRALHEHGVLEAQLGERLHQAQAALRSALQRHGLEGLQAYPATGATPAAVAPTRSVFLGVPMLAAAFVPPARQGADLALDASPQARACRDAFVALLEPLALLAAGVGNLERLGAEYRRTERRARALENVLLPEIETALRRIEGHLELADQEEAARIRLAGRHR